MNLRLALGVLVIAGQLFAADQGDGLKMALGLKPKIFISVAIDKELAASLTSEQIKNDAELLLRQSNVPVVANSGDGLLLIYVKASRFTLRETSLYAVLSEVDYVEPVAPDAALIICSMDGATRKSFEKTFDCTRPHTVMASLWRKDSVMQVGDHRIQELRPIIRDLVQQFVLEYLRSSDASP